MTSMAASSSSGEQPQIETAAAGLDWLNEGVFVRVGGRQPDCVVYETYLVQ